MSYLYVCRTYVRYRGEFTVGNETYSVEPVDGTLIGTHRVYKESDIIQPSLRCGMQLLIKVHWLDLLWNCCINYKKSCNMSATMHNKSIASPQQAALVCDIGRH